MAKKSDDEYIEMSELGGRPVGGEGQTGRARRTGRSSSLDSRQSSPRGSLRLPSTTSSRSSQSSPDFRRWQFPGQDSRQPSHLSFDPMPQPTRWPPPSPRPIRQQRNPIPVQPTFGSSSLDSRQSSPGGSLRLPSPTSSRRSQSSPGGSLILPSPTSSRRSQSSPNFRRWQFPGEGSRQPSHLSFDPMPQPTRWPPPSPRPKRQQRYPIPVQPTLDQSTHFTSTDSTSRQTPTISGLSHRLSHRLSSSLGSLESPSTIGSIGSHRRRLSLPINPIPLPPTFPLTAYSPAQSPGHRPVAPMDIRLDIPEAAGGSHRGSIATTTSTVGNDCRICYEAPQMPYYICDCTSGMCSDCLFKLIASREQTNGRLLTDDMTCEVCRQPYRNIQLVRRSLLLGYRQRVANEMNLTLNTNQSFGAHMLQMLGSPLLCLAAYLILMATFFSENFKTGAVVGGGLAVTYYLYYAGWLLHQVFEHIQQREGPVVGVQVDTSKAQPKQLRDDRNDDNDNDGSDGSGSQQV